MEASSQPRPTNQLIHATSPYLLQHARNPVDWCEWGPEALARAVREDKPIFLSIGYSACHWCHVMEQESFSDELVADYLNSHFVSIKVDREERPDLDEIYMQVTLAFNRGRGGWPMTLFLTTDQRPIWAGTYLPRDQFMLLCRRVDEVWREQRELVREDADRVEQHLRQWAAGPPPADAAIPADVVDNTARLLASHFDTTRGGLQSDSNKFPPSLTLELLLRVYRRTGDAALRQGVEVTLDHMARGGIYDHVGGGICRYSTDPDWLVPHFEKMLYDQALVSSIYLDAFQATGTTHYATVARDILDYVLDDLRDPAGGFYSSRDADSAGQEGAYYIWTVAQVREVLGPDDADLFNRYYDVTEAGNWSDPLGHAPPGPKNILHVPQSLETFARLHGLDTAELDQRLGPWRTRMRAARAGRVPPGLDDKILSGWNGLMIASLAKAAAVLDEPRYAAAASQAAEFVLARMCPDGALLHTCRLGVARLPAYLDDYAFFIEGLLNLYEATFEPRWLESAARLNELVLRDFSGPDGVFYYTPAHGERLLVRTRNVRDGAIPSGNSVQVANLLRLGAFLGQPELRARAEGVLRGLRPMVDDAPGAFDRLLSAVDLFHSRMAEVVIVGVPGRADTHALLRAVRARYWPNKVVLLGDGRDTAGSLSPLLEGKAMVGNLATAYVCEDRTCRRPTTQPDEFVRIMEELSQGRR